MKIKNLKIHQKAVSKLATYALVGTLAIVTLTGCSENDNLLKGTMLENTCVVTFKDGSKDVAVMVNSCSEDENRHHIYYSIISGDYFTNTECNKTKEPTGAIVYHYEIEKKENIVNYLTADDLAKASQGELSRSDIITIVSRTIDPPNEEINQDTKTR